MAHVNVDSNATRDPSLFERFRAKPPADAFPKENAGFHRETLALRVRPWWSDGSSEPWSQDSVSLLYTEPRLYDLVFPDTDGGLERMCRDAFRRYMPASPASALDIGCGTARTLDALADTVADCWGVDLLDTNVRYARSTRPRLHVVQGDMRACGSARTFDLVTSFGNALSYAITDDDVARTMDTYAAHAHGGTLVIVDALNARSYLDGDGFRERIDGSVDSRGSGRRPSRCTSWTAARGFSSARRVWRIPRAGPTSRTTRSTGCSTPMSSSAASMRRASRCWHSSTTASSGRRTSAAPPPAAPTRAACGAASSTPSRAGAHPSRPDHSESLADAEVITRRRGPGGRIRRRSSSPGPLGV